MKLKASKNSLLLIKNGTIYAIREIYNTTAEVKAKGKRKFVALINNLKEN